MTPAGSRPTRAVVTYRGTRYWLDLARCRRALVCREVDGELSSMWSLAVAAHVSRSTVSRFFAGQTVSLRTTLRVLAVLHLEFRDVVVPLEAVEGGT